MPLSGQKGHGRTLCWCDSTQLLTTFALKPIKIDKTFSKHPDDFSVPKDQRRKVGACESKTRKTLVGSKSLHTGEPRNCVPEMQM